MSLPDRIDQALMEQFQQTAWQGRPEIAERLTDERIRECAWRLIYMEAPQVLLDNARVNLG